MAQKYPVKKQVPITHSLQSCTRKRTWRTVARAHQERNCMEMEHGEAYQVYYCVWCRGFHVGRPVYREAIGS